MESTPLTSHAPGSSSTAFVELASSQPTPPATLSASAIPKALSTSLSTSPATSSSPSPRAAGAASSPPSRSAVFVTHEPTVRRIAAEQHALVPGLWAQLEKSLDESLALMGARTRMTPTGWSTVFVDPVMHFFEGLSEINAVGTTQAKRAAAQQRVQSGNIRLRGTPTEADVMTRMIGINVAQRITFSGVPGSPYVTYRDRALPRIEQLLAGLPARLKEFATDDESYEILEAVDRALRGLHAPNFESTIDGICVLELLGIKLRACQNNTFTQARERLESLRVEGAVRRPFTSWADCRQVAHDLLSIAYADETMAVDKKQFTRTRLIALIEQVKQAMQPALSNCIGLSRVDPELAKVLLPRTAAVFQSFRRWGQVPPQTPAAEYASALRASYELLPKAMDSLVMALRVLPYPNAVFTAPVAARDQAPLGDAAPGFGAGVASFTITASVAVADSTLATSFAATRLIDESPSDIAWDALVSAIDPKARPPASPEPEGPPSPDQGPPLSAASLALDILSVPWPLLARRLDREAHDRNFIGGADIMAIGIRLKNQRAVELPDTHHQVLLSLCAHVDALSRRGLSLPLDALRDLAVNLLAAPPEVRSRVAASMTRNFRCKAEDGSAHAAFSQFLSRPENRLAPLISGLCATDPAQARPGFEKLTRYLAGISGAAFKAAVVAEQDSNFTLPGVDARTRNRIVANLHVFAARTLASLLPELQHSPPHRAFAAALLDKLGLDAGLLDSDPAADTIESRIFDRMATRFPKELFLVTADAVTVNAHNFDSSLTGLIVRESVRRGDRPIKINVGSGSHSNPSNFRYGLPPVRAAALEAVARSTGWVAEELNDSTLVFSRAGSRRRATRPVDLTPFTAEVTYTSDL